MPFTTFLANKVLDHIDGKTSYTAPTVYIGLSSTTPALGGTGVTEPASGSYARVVTSGATWNASASGAVTNASTITFPTATGDWLTGANLTYGLLYDAATSGNLLGYGALTVAKNVLNGDTMSIAAGALTISLS